MFAFVQTVRAVKSLNVFEWGTSTGDRMRLNYLVYLKIIMKFERHCTSPVFSYDYVFNGYWSYCWAPRFTMRKCSKIIDSTNLQQCKETFNLYYFDAGSDFANALRPSWDALTYKRIDKIAADKLFVVSTKLSLVLAWN